MLDDARFNAEMYDIMLGSLWASEESPPPADADSFNDADSTDSDDNDEEPVPTTFGDGNPV